MDREPFDFIVIGAGSGGVAAANRAAMRGARVALIEQDRLGGTCVNRGCVPKKISWLAAHTAEVARSAQGYGFAPLAPRIDFGALRRARDRYISWLNERYAEGLDVNQVTLLRGHGRFVDEHSLRVGERLLTAKYILIATGARVRPLNVPGGDLALDSNDFFKLDRLPARVAMIGAGYIAAELGGIFAALGSHVDMYLGGRLPMAHFDPFVGDVFRDALKYVGVNPRSANAEKIIRDERGFTVQCDEDEARYDAVFAAIGRIPNTEGLDLGAAGVALDANGAVHVDKFHATNLKHIYAVGDVTGRTHALTPVAIAGGRRLAEHLFAGAPPREIDSECIPTVVFSHPPIGMIGLTEAQARARYGEAVKVYTNRFRPLTSALAPEKQDAAIKLVTTGENERIVGLHVIGDGADELMQGFAVVIRMGATKRDFDETIAIHPTLAEEVVTLR
jgi:glutathione reductase (NADPH)